MHDNRVSGTPFFSGLKIGYEYLTPCALYASVSILGAGSQTDFNVSNGDESLVWQKGDKGFGNIEARIGYTFCWMATPFFGVGSYNVYNVDHHNHQGFTEALPYVTVGVRAKHVFSPCFDLVVNGKILRTFGAKQEFSFVEGKSTAHKNSWGGEIGIPLVWHIGCTQRWDIQLEPYFLMLDFAGKQYAYGGKLLFGYRF